MKKQITLTESERNEILKMHQKHGYKQPLNESYWDRLFGRPTVKDAAHDSLRGKGYSHIAKDDDDQQHIVFNGEKFHPDNIEYASHDDLGEIPRVENGKLIIANPAWSL